LKHHLESGEIEPNSTPLEKVLELLPESHTCIDFPTWLSIDQVEKDNGKQIEKLREKILTKDEMMNIASKS